MSKPDHDHSHLLADAATGQGMLVTVRCESDTDCPYCQHQTTEDELPPGFKDIGRVDSVEKFKELVEACGGTVGEVESLSQA